MMKKLAEFVKHHQSQSVYSSSLRVSQPNRIYRLFPNYRTCYDIIIGLHVAISISRASYSSTAIHPPRYVKDR